LFILLSHKLSEDTPAFADGPSLRISPIKEITSGGSSNSYTLTFPNHLGTHMDAPLHFDASGRPIADYEIEELVFENPVILDIPKGDSELIAESELRDATDDLSDADLLLLRTGFEQYRDTDPVRYSTRNPAISPDAAAYVRNELPSVIAICLDTISASAVQHREEGRETHRTLLSSRDFFIIEDAALSRYSEDIQRVLAIPLYIVGVDSAPCTLLGETMLNTRSVRR
jgi:kynurenine formamidase